MTNLLTAAFLWIISHLGLSNTRIRSILIRLLSKQGFLATYSLIAIGSIIYLIVSYNHLESNAYLWLPIPAFHWITLLLMPVACVLFVGAFVTVNPSMIGQGQKIANISQGSGMIRITRHPFQWAIFIWAVLHILSKGTVGSLIFFGSFGFVSLVGTTLIDKKKSLKLGADWQKFSGVTSNIPFIAILQGRNQLNFKEIWLPVMIGLNVYALLFYSHQLFFGVALM